MKFTKVKKFLKKSSKQFIIKSTIDWNRVHKAIDCEGIEYRISKVDNNNIRVIGDGHDRITPNSIAFRLLDMYDDNGNKVSSMEDYQ